MSLRSTGVCTLEKQTELADLDDIVWHFIGPLQSNKTRAVAEHFDWVHSVDRLKIAKRLSEREHWRDTDAAAQEHRLWGGSRSGTTQVEL